MTWRLTTDDYRVDAMAMAKALLGMTLCRRLDGGTVLRARIVEARMSSLSLSQMTGPMSPLRWCIP